MCLLLDKLDRVIAKDSPRLETHLAFPASLRNGLNGGRDYCGSPLIAVLKAAESVELPQSALAPQSALLPQSASKPSVVSAPHNAFAPQSALAPQRALLPETLGAPATKAFAPQTEVAPQSALMPQTALGFETNYNEPFVELYAAVGDSALREATVVSDNAA